MQKERRLTLLLLLSASLLHAQVPADSLQKPDEVRLREAAVQDSLRKDSLASLPLFLEKKDIPARLYYGTDWNTENTRSTYCFDKTRTFILPLDSAHFRYPAIGGKVISPYGPRGGRMHTGTDYKQQLGDTIRAAWDGVVRMAKKGYYGYGGIVVIRHPNGIETFYAHLSAIKVRTNQKVKAGDLVGLAGRTGRASTEHLHFETRFQYESFNPALLIDFNTGSLLTDTLVVDRGKFYTMAGYRAKQKQPQRKEVIWTDSLCTPDDSLPVVDTAVSRVVEKGVTDTLQAKLKPATSSKQASKPSYHTVRSGDTLYAIARKYHTTVAKLCEINHIKENGILSLGQKIKLP